MLYSMFVLIKVNKMAICTVFFMVLDLRLTMRLAVRDGWPFLL